MKAIKNLDRFAKSQKKVLKILLDSKIKSSNPYEGTMFTKVYKRFRDQRKPTVTSMSYNRYLQKNLPHISRELSEIENSVKILERSRDARNEKLCKDLETSYERDERIYDMINQGFRKRK
ncbi:MAG: hypothetical protein ACJA0U_000383 [Salibacteraceae bacterium]|jgi:hypothetical protein